MKEVIPMINNKSFLNDIITVAEAEKDAQTIKGEGDRIATEIWNKATSVDPEFYAFYRSLEAYKNSFDEDTSVVLAQEGEFF